MSIFDKILPKRGAEKVDKTPVTIPVNLRRSESMDERIRRILAHSASQHAIENDLETFEEADDFDIPDDPIDPSTPWEHDFDMPAMQAIDAGVVKKPEIDPARARELREKYARKPKPKKTPLEDAIDKTPPEPPKSPAE